MGHGAIDFYFEIDPKKGINRECTDFSTPDNFPSEIATAIKTGKFRGLGICLAILSQHALVEYEKIKQPALAEYEEIQQLAFWDLFVNFKNRKKVWQ